MKRITLTETEASYLRKLLSDQISPNAELILLKLDDSGSTSGKLVTLNGLAYRALQEEFSEDNDTEARAVFRDAHRYGTLYKLVMPDRIWEQSRRYCRMWIEDEDGATAEAIRTGDVSKHFRHGIKTGLLRLDEATDA